MFTRVYVKMLIRECVMREKENTTLSRRAITVFEIFPYNRN